MKRIVCLCIIMSMLCISFSGCKKEIKLTESNIRKYLSIQAEYERIEGEDVYVSGVRLTDGDTHYITFKIAPKKSGTFENVSFDIKDYIYSSLEATIYDDEWVVAERDLSYNEDEPSTLAEKIELPTDGKYTSRKHKVIRRGEGIKDSEPNTDTLVINVKGTFVEE